MDFAKSIAGRSTCNVPNRNIGCVIVSGDNTKVLALGYNGGAKGDDNVCEYDPENPDGLIDGHTCGCIHAEMNALTKLDTSSVLYKKMYLTLAPCNLCWKLIVNAGINEVIFYEAHRPENLKKLMDRGVKVRPYDEDKGD